MTQLGTNVLLSTVPNRLLKVASERTAVELGCDLPPNKWTPMAQVSLTSVFGFSSRFPSIVWGSDSLVKSVSGVGYRTTRCN